jgi:hypothetical protein
MITHLAGTILALYVAWEKGAHNMARNISAVTDARSIHSIVEDTMGVDQLYDIMNVLRNQYNRTTDRARRAGMGKVIDAAASTVVNDFRRYYLQHNEGDSD